MDNEAVLKNLIRIGKVVSINPAKATARVQFSDRDSLVSHDLQVICQNTKDVKEYHMPVIGEDVVCLFMPIGVESGCGFVVGAVYAGSNAAPVSDAAKHHITFVDGTVIEYDYKTHTLKADVKGSATLKTSGNASVEASGTLAAKSTGAATLETAASATVKAPTITLDGNVNVTGSMTVANGLSVTGGNCTAAGSLTANSVADSVGTMAGIRTKFNQHTHTSPGTNTPTPTM